MSALLALIHFETEQETECAGNKGCIPGTESVSQWMAAFFSAVLKYRDIRRKLICVMSL